MEDINKFKPYISHLNRQLQELKPLLENLNTKSLDEQLLLLNDERARLDLTNKYAYVLSSLMFAYMKVLNVKDMAPVMSELSRVKSYMDQARKLDASQEQKEEVKKKEHERATGLLRNALEPSISKVNFEGKHTRFVEQDESQDESQESSLESSQKPLKNTSCKTRKTVPGRSQGRVDGNTHVKTSKSRSGVSKPKSKGGPKSNKASTPSKRPSNPAKSNR
ncbi:LRP1 (YHR081W) [Zygosaccharomyces parabailii]|uniref:Exosome complex protein n=1 Tax=Zygosaccharomyces bailii (strain CLIB 213 / ATCC 58445 / CBS 680 / BCRC 21525 / NBRC 1098 / NCYC 1416 / NRRL Y-2227) TaxID=1333698 RepID=A0A8J2T7S4_ZYGB2|nr:LRP1 (YHR081W) [Zygosaccharomyces parabailii]CDF88785.1 ZYBA0S03-01882g1_1 [Zygosaccharomyces bailii CLIB 213]CDH15873.1 related to Exosome complex protein LRP1 [Zygosaccharomyces bailii ISA1307]